MKMNSVFLSEKANEDIRNILQYSEEKYGNRMATAYRLKLADAIQSILSMPTRGHKRKDLPTDYLSLGFNEHVIIYQFEEHKEIVQIIRILHRRMDFRNKF